MSVYEVLSLSFMCITTVLSVLVLVKLIKLIDKVNDKLDR